MCFMTPNAIFLYPNLVFIAFLSYDIFVIAFFIKKWDPMSVQMLWHHMVGLTGDVVVLASGYSCPGLGCLMIPAEFSSIFMSYRSMYKKEELGNPVPFMHTICFFLSFTVLRIFNFPIIFVLTLKSFKYLWHHVSTVRKICVCIAMFQFFAFWILNLFWYKKIAKTAAITLGWIKIKGKVEQVHLYGEDNDKKKM
jgi:hypothetical protein